MIQKVSLSFIATMYAKFVQDICKEKQRKIFLDFMHNVIIQLITLKHERNV